MGRSEVTAYQPLGDITNEDHLKQYARLLESRQNTRDHRELMQNMCAALIDSLFIAINPQQRLTKADGLAQKTKSLFSKNIRYKPFEFVHQNRNHDVICSVAAKQKDDVFLPISVVMEIGTRSKSKKAIPNPKLTLSFDEHGVAKDVLLELNTMNTQLIKTIAAQIDREMGFTFSKAIDQLVQVSHQPTTSKLRFSFSEGQNPDIYMEFLQPHNSMLGFKSSITLRLDDQAATYLPESGININIIPETKLGTDQALQYLYGLLLMFGFEIDPRSETEKFIGQVDRELGR